ncbi:MAG TPA: anti-sigma factor [Acidimicrobiales bacterium]|nr:anti-sigma factor [Acidimicrobiales bacterium]
MNENEIEELLGAYALDAVDASERDEIEAHLLVCPRCRAEVAAHREVATLLANGGAIAPEGLWNKIASEIAPPIPDLTGATDGLLARLSARGVVRGRHSRALLAPVLASAAAIVVIALLSAQVFNLTSRVHAQSTNALGMNAAVNSVLAHPHRSILLTSSTHDVDATVIFGSDGNAYWVSSNLARLPVSKTYQLWALVGNAKVVSLGVLGANPKHPSAFRIEPQMHELMVTIEPAGGNPGPTTRVILSAMM